MPSRRSLPEMLRLQQRRLSAEFVCRSVNFEDFLNPAVWFQRLETHAFESGWMMIDAWQIPDPYDACTKGIRAVLQLLNVNSIE